jgi:hypothetical protein
MHFPLLTELGSHYAAEEGTEGVRRGALDGVATALRQVRMDLAAARQRAGQQVNTGTVQERIAFFRNQANSGQRDQAEREVKDLERRIANGQEKLTRQGAVLRPDGTIDWTLTSRQVVYDHTAAAQGLTMLHMQGGLIYTDAACQQKFDTSAMVTHFGGRGWAIYVMSPTGNLHASPHSVGHRHHSSLLAGGNVSGAGEIRVLQGKLAHISNKSGHYAPGAAHLLQVLYVLNKRGVDMHGTRVSFKTPADQGEFPSVAAFLADCARKGIETDFEYAKMMAYLDAMGYGAFVPLAAAQGWCWGTPADFGPGGAAQGGRGVVRIAERTQVPHRDVRKWLKGLGRVLPNTVQSGYGR